MMRFLRNWKTTVPGIGLILTGVGSIAGGQIEAGVAQIMAGLGLVAAKDADRSHTTEP